MTDHNHHFLSQEYLNIQSKLNEKLGDIAKLKAWIADAKLTTESDYYTVVVGLNLMVLQGKTPSENEFKTLRDATNARDSILAMEAAIPGTETVLCGELKARMKEIDAIGMSN